MFLCIQQLWANPLTSLVYQDWAGKEPLNTSWVAAAILLSACSHRAILYTMSSWSADICNEFVRLSNFQVNKFCLRLYCYLTHLIHADHSFRKSSNMCHVHIWLLIPATIKYVNPRDKTVTLSNQVANRS